jgi:short-subunit dehydrogenase
MRFHGQTVWITGASAGIGAALARAFAAEGARLLLSARRLPELEAQAEALRAAHPGSAPRVLRVDMTDPASFPAAVEAAGPVDVLVHNAGISQRAHMLDTDPADERRLLETNFFGPAQLTRLAVPGMAARGGGRLVYISSVAGLVGTPFRSGYSASKFALNGWCEAVRAELAPKGISVTVVCPGFVATEIARSAVGARGQAFGQGDGETSGGLDPEAVAHQIVRATHARRDQVVIAGKEGLAPWLRLLLPGTLASILRKRAAMPPSEG